MTVTMNSTPRKSLATQLDRLDTILDGLADGLNEAVAGTVKDAVTSAVSAAVEQVLTKVLSSPELLQRMQADQKPVPQHEPKQSLVRRIGKMVRGLWNRAKAAACSGFHQAKAIASQSRRIVQNKIRALVVRIRGAIPVSVLLAKTVAVRCWQHRKPILLASSVGAVVGLGCYFAGPIAAALTTSMATGGMAGVAVNRLPRISRFVRRQTVMPKPATS